MKPSRKLLKKLALVLTASTVISLGFLSAAGVSYLLLQIAFFFLATVYENQVYAESISTGLRRMFNPNHLAHGVVRQHLEKQIKIKAHRDNNAFLEDYYKLKEYATYLHQKIHHEEHKHRAGESRAARKIRIKALKEDFKNTKQRLVKMESFFLRQLKTIENQCTRKTELEKTVFDHLKDHTTKLTDEIRWKKKYIRASWITAIAGGISSGLAGYSAMMTALSIQNFAILSAMIPGGFIFTLILTLTVLTAIGYTLLLYQTIADMVQKYGHSIKESLVQKPGESKARYRARCVGTAIAIGLALFATFATAGTWWHASKSGALLLSAGEYIANVTRIICIPLMAIGMMLFSVKNNIESANDISESNYSKLIDDIKERVRKTPKRLFFNIPWLIAISLEYTYKAILFGGHLASIGAVSDNVDGVPAAISILLISANEGLTDMNFLPKKHQHNSFLLKILYAPMLFITKCLRFVAFLWDVAFSWNVKESWKNTLAHSHGEGPKEQEKPTQSSAWYQQELIESCKTISQRLEKEKGTIAKDKVQQAKLIKKLAYNSNLPKLNSIKDNSFAIFSANRSSLWKKKITTSQVEIQGPLLNYVTCR